MITVQDVGKRYGTLTALSDLTFSIERGEIVGLLGQNGAGKTTLIKLLLNFLPLQSGAINIQGISVSHPKSRQQIFYLPEKFQAPLYLTGQAYLSQTARAHRVSYHPDILKPYLEQLSLTHQDLQKNLHTYSKGMMQKLGLNIKFL